MEASGAESRLYFETLRAVSDTLSARQVLERLLLQLMSHFGAEAGAALRVTSDQRLTFETTVGLSPEVTGETTLKLGSEISGWVAANGRPLLVDDLGADARFEGLRYEAAFGPSLISVPVFVEGTARGVVTLGRKRTGEPFRTEELGVAVSLASLVASALRNAERFEALRERVDRDSLTGLANHRRFWVVLDRELERADRYARPLSVVMIDVDGFKEFNDAHGHIAGDAALARIAALIQNSCRNSDRPARYGGDEFAVVLPETSLEGARAFAEKMRQSVEEQRFAGDGLTVSIGLSAYPADGKLPRPLVAAADENLYASKQTGRNRVTSPPRA